MLIPNTKFPTVIKAVSNMSRILVTNILRVDTSSEAAHINSGNARGLRVHIDYIGGPRAPLAVLLTRSWTN